MFSGPEFNFIGHRMKAFYYVTDAFEVPETSEVGNTEEQRGGRHT